MANEDIQKESPGGIRKQPPQAETPPKAPDNDHRFRRPDPVWNPMARIALYLGVFSGLPILMGLVALWVFGRDLLGYSNPTWPLGGPEWYLGASEWCAFPSPVLGLAALLFDILGLRYYKRHPTAGGRGYTIFGIWMGLAA